MKTARVRIYLTTIQIIKSIFSSHSKSKKYIEEILKNKLKKKNIFFSGMCRTSYMIILDYLRKTNPEKNEIILCSYNLPEMVNLTLLKKYKIRFIDIDIKSGVMNLKKLFQACNESTAAVLYTNMFNNSEDLDDVKNLCKLKNILLIEDNAIYLGNYTIVNNQKKYAGSFGDVSLLSFGMMKNYNSLYGGACLTSIDDLAEYIESKQNSLKKFNIFDYLDKIILFIILKLSLSKNIYNLFFFKIIRLSEKKNINFLKKIFYPALKFKVKNSIPKKYESKMPKLCYSILAKYFKDNQNSVDTFEIRKKNNSLYFDELSNQKGISLIPIKDKNFQNYLDFPVLITEKKKELVNYLFDQGLEVRTHFYSNCEKYFNDNINNNSSFYEDNIICLPSHSLIAKEQVLEYCKYIKIFFNNIHG